MRAIHHGRDRELTIEMTPMIDVVFQLLIFFICTASFERMEELLPTNMLTQGSQKTQVEVEPEIDPLEPVVVKLLLADGRVVWDISGNRLPSLAAVRTRLNALGGLSGAREKLPVILDIAQEVPLGDVIDVYDLCKTIGFEKIQFAAKVPL